MLEKMGLPAKPSLRGNNWVVDASHCQGCAAQFTFINRKHHCRRCGGLFCNSCTQHRMVLRGQGDSPVRICEPCTKLEEAARFELRHGHRNRAGQGRSKILSTSEDEILTQILVNDTKRSSSARTDAPDMERMTSNASCSSNLEDTSVEGRRELDSVSLEDLRRQALDEKKRYKILKGEGKPEEALKAFKKGKELERQANALELSLRKGRKKALHAIHMENVKPDPEEKPHAGSKDKGKDDLLSELRGLGWTDQDLHGADKKPATMSLEGELSTLIGEINQNPFDGMATQSVDKAQVTAHKRKALMLKREGKLAEAKEELKKAKVLEKQIEEQQLLGGAEDSDDELSALMRTVDADGKGEFSMGQDHGFALDDLMGVGDTMVVDGNFEVTDDDMVDPEIAAALKSFGWDEESHNSDLLAQSTLPRREAPFNTFSEKEVERKKDGNFSSQVNGSHVSQGDSGTLGLPRRSKAEIQRELLSLKRKALALRRGGKTEEAEEVLAIAKSLEAQIADMEAPKGRLDVEQMKIEKEVGTSPKRTVDAEDGDDITERDLGDPSLLSMLKDLGWNDECEPGTAHEVSSKQTDRASSTAAYAILSAEGSTAAPTSKAKIQRDLLGLKRKALDLRRKGDMEEAEKVLSMARELEAEIDEMESRKVDDGSGKGTSDCSMMSVQRERHGVIDDAMTLSKPSAPKEQEPLVTDFIGVSEVARKHLADEGKLASFSGSKSVNAMDFLTGDDWSSSQASNDRVEDKPSPVSSSHSSALPNVQEESKRKVHLSLGMEVSHPDASSFTNVNSVTQPLDQSESRTSLHREILAHKKKAVALKREGKLAEAREELKRAKLLEKSLEDDKPQPSASIPSSTVPAPATEEQQLVKSNTKPLLSSRERFRVQQESLAHKRQALKLRKEGRIKEAEAELDLAKTLEAQLEESASHEPRRSSEGGADDVVVDDLLDPELLSALTAIGIANAASSAPNKKTAPLKTPGSSSNNNSIPERMRLEEQIKAEKLKAVRLKRAGKQAEALDSLRQVKLLEKKLNSLGLD